MELLAFGDNSLRWKRTPKQNRILRVEQSALTMSIEKSLHNLGIPADLSPEEEGARLKTLYEEHKQQQGEAMTDYLRRLTGTVGVSVAISGAGGRPAKANARVPIKRRK